MWWLSDCDNQPRLSIILGSTVLYQISKLPFHRVVKLTSYLINLDNHGACGWTIAFSHPDRINTIYENIKQRHKSKQHDCVKKCRLESSLSRIETKRMKYFRLDATTWPLVLVKIARVVQRLSRASEPSTNRSSFASNVSSWTGTDA